MKNQWRMMKNRGKISLKVLKHFFQDIFTNFSHVSMKKNQTHTGIAC